MAARCDPDLQVMMTAATPQVGFLTLAIGVARLVATALRKAYQIKISLSDAKPPIWRRLLIADATPLSRFHGVIQIVMGWTDSHLHQFVAGGNYYGRPDPDSGFREILDEHRYKLSQLLKKEKDSLIYEYDFGDSWEHKVTLEKILPLDPDAVIPRCVKAKGACPPEDVGGIYGYHNFIEALNDPAHPEHEDLKDWIGGDFDPQFVDVDAINAQLLEYCR